MKKKSAKAKAEVTPSETDIVRKQSQELEPEPGLGFWMLVGHAEKMEKERDEARNALLTFKPV